MSGDGNSAIVSDAEIEAALAEAEAHADGIPDLDDGAGAPEVVHVPLDASRPLRGKREPVAIVQSPGAPTDEEAADADADDTPRTWHQRLLHQVYVAIDTLLWAVNRPFQWLSPDARRLVGAVAAVTIVMTIAAHALLPTLFPPRDPVSVLERQSTAARTGDGQAAR
jgi:hypothetical protein